MKKGIKMDTQFLTDNGRQRALSQLEFLRTVKRAEVAQYLHEAKESGDVIDNAAYEDAKDAQARLEGRILELEQMLAAAQVISHVPTHEISLVSVLQFPPPPNQALQHTFF